MAGYAVTTYADGTTGFRTATATDELAPGEVYTETLPTPSLADIATALSAAVQAWLDETARDNGYDSLFSCISYLNSAISQYAADAARALAWRDAVWPACFQWLQGALANPPAVFPSAAEVIAQLPQPGAYGWVVHTPGATA